MTLPLSYSRLRPSPLRLLALKNHLDANNFFCRIPAKKIGGEARIRTLVATGTTDLQSVAIDRSATSPSFSCPASGGTFVLGIAFLMDTVCFRAPSFAPGALVKDGAGEGI